LHASSFNTGLRRIRERRAGRRFVLCLALLGAAAWCEAAEPAPAKPHRLVVQPHILNRYVRELDGQWAGNLFASDGRCYFFSSTHNARHGAAFFRYDPRTGEIKVLSEDITRVCGEDPAKSVPQGKVHSAMEELDGWLYFATHLARYRRNEAAAYPGAHVVGYQLATGKFRDYGVIHPHYSCYAGFAVDPARKVAYVFVRPFGGAGGRDGGPHLYRLHLDTGEKEDLGRLYRGGGAAYHLFVDHRGDCWFGLRGVLYQVKAATREIKRWAGVLPDGRNNWHWTQALPDRKGCLLTMAGGRKVYRFDATVAPDRPDAFRALREIGPSHLGMVYDAAGNRVFYVQREGGKPYGRNGGAYRDLHLLSVSLDPALDDAHAVTDHGLLCDTEGRQPWKLASLSTDGRGRIFMVGAWHCLPGEEKAVGVYKGRRWGYCAQSFTVADLSADRASTAGR